MDHHNLTLEYVARMAKSMGSDGFINLASSLPEVGAKYGAISLGQVEAFFNMIALDDLDRVLAQEASIKVIDVIKSLFDSTGRVIPPRGFKPSVKDENTDFYLDSCAFEDIDILERLEDYLPQYQFPSLGEFQDRCGSAKEKVLDNPLIGPNAFKRCHILLPLPHIPELADIKNLGQVVEGLVEMAGKSYEDEFRTSSRKFKNHRQGTLTNQIYVVSGTRHDLVLKAVSQGPQTGIFLPNSLQGYSIQADKAIIQLFPDFVSLAGIEYILAMIACPGILARDYNTPGLDIAALQWQSAGRSLFFKASDGKLDFDRADYLSRANVFYSGGLLFFG